MAKARNLLLCFDAFGTLFKIKQPIEQQYGEVARRQFGLTTRRDGSPLFTDDQLRASFRAAFKAASRQHPNYGHTSSMGAIAWWTSVIEDTFRPFVDDPPRGLAPRLIERFASSEAYTMAPQLKTLLRELRLQKPKRYHQIVVGVITNSDDRVPDILGSMGLHVSQLRYGSLDPDRQCKTPEDTAFLPDRTYDIDFHCMSYDVGVEKPDPRIFKAAEEMLPAALASKASVCTDQSGEGLPTGQQGIGHQVIQETYDKQDTRPFALGSWDRMYVGDEWDKDIVGAKVAGWFPVLLHEPEKGEPPLALEEVQPLTQLPSQSIDSLSTQCTAASVPSIASLLYWLMN